MSKNKNIFKILREEISLGFLGILGTSIENKVGLGMFLTFVGILMLILPINNEENKPIFFFLIGIFLTLSGIYLFYSRIKEIRNKKN